MFGSENEDVVDLLKQLAGSPGFDAKATFEEALAIQRKLPGSDPWRVTNLLENLAALALWTGDLGEAAATCREAMKIERQRMLTFPGHHVDEGPILADLARAIDQRKSIGTQPKRTIPGWGQLNDPNGDSTFEVVDGRVKATVPPSRSFTGGVERIWMYWNNSPRLLQPINGDFTVQVRVSGTLQIGESYEWNSMGLLLWHDDKNFFYFLRRQSEKDEPDHDSVSCFYAAARNEGTSSGKWPVLRSSRGGDGSIYLRVSRRRNMIAAEASVDGVEWARVGSAELPFPQSVSVGVSAENNHSTKPAIFEFSDFKLTKPTHE